ncbi:MAG: family 43 glycosylhydrolase [Ruminococcus sp.]|nr:family 43 glycosylhydrolase [Ruminococcus sp.]
MKKMISAALAAVMAVSAFNFTAPETAKADNPIVQTSFTPDPAPVVFGDELYVFTGCDREGNNDFYYMTGWQCFSTKDMKNWTDHGRILEDTSFSWCGKNDAWASQCIERNGKYYFYFTTTNQGPGGGGRAIGVAVADSPEGPYKDVLGKPLCGPDWAYIDPTVMIDDDGQAWLMFGNPTCYYVKLKEDMVTLDGEIKSFDMTSQQFGPPAGEHKTSYGEGPWICKHNGLYYLIWASFLSEYGGESQCYATGPSPTGPWTYRGAIQQGSNCFTTHGGIIDYKDHSYFFYHKNGLTGGGPYNRSASCEEFTFNADGTIPVMKLTKSGPDQIEALNPFERVEAETINWCEGVKTEKCSEGGVNIGNIKDGSYVRVTGVDFGAGADSFKASVAAAGEGGTMEIHLDAKDGPVVGVLRVSGTGGWQDWEEVSTNISGASGEHDVYFVFRGTDTYLMNVDWWQFDGEGSTAAGDKTYIFQSGFESGTDGWSGRGAAKVAKSADEYYNGAASALVSGRTAAWNGVSKALGYKFKAGESYSFSANVKYTTGEPTNTFHFTLQYDDGAGGDAVYKKIDTQTVTKGEWTQLANTSFTIPEGAKNCYIYVETEGDEGIDFYVDDIAAAVDGTVIPGAGSSGFTVIPGDLTFDGKIDVFDMILARKTLVNQFAGTSNNAKVLKAADVDGNGEYTVADMVQIAKFLLGKSKKFEQGTTTTTKSQSTTTTTVTAGKTPTGDYMAQIANDMKIKEDSSVTSKRSGVDYGKLESKTYYSKDAGKSKGLNVLLPPGYNASEKYPVLYVMHGIFGNQNSMLDDSMKIQTMLGNLIADGKAEKMIVVFPDMFTSSTATPGFTNESSRAYDAIRDDLENSIMPFMAENYSIKTGRENTAITGFSMGGREALYTGITRSEVYGYVGGACPAPGIFKTNDGLMDHEGSLKQESEFKPSTKPYMILISAAQHDGTVGTYPESYHNVLTSNSVEHLWQIIPDGDHGGNTVRPHMYNFLRYVFKAA